MSRIKKIIAFKTNDLMVHDSAEAAELHVRKLNAHIQGLKHRLATLAMEQRKDRKALAGLYANANVVYAHRSGVGGTWLYKNTPAFKDGVRARQSWIAQRTHTIRTVSKLLEVERNKLRQGAQEMLFNG